MHVCFRFYKHYFEYGRVWSENIDDNKGNPKEEEEEEFDLHKQFGSSEHILSRLAQRAVFYNYPLSPISLIKACLIMFLVISLLI